MVFANIVVSAIIQSWSGSFVIESDNGLIKEKA